MSDPRIDSLAQLAPRPVAASLKSEFFMMMPAIEAALEREVTWKDILADLARSGFHIKPELAANYAAQYRRRHRPADERGRPGRPRKAASDTPARASAPPPRVTVPVQGRPQRRVANLVRPGSID